MASSVAEPPQNVPLLIDFASDDIDMANAPSETPLQQAHKQGTSKLDHGSTRIVHPEDPTLKPVREGLEAVSLQGAPRAPRAMLHGGTDPHSGEPLRPAIDSAIVPVGNIARPIKKLRANRFLAPGNVAHRAPRYSHVPLEPYRGGDALSLSKFAPQEGALVMGDIDSRRHYRGGGNRGYAGQKRRQRDDDDDYDRPQRSYRPEPPSSRVRKLILSIAENPMSRPSDDVIVIAKEITDNYDDEIFRRNISDILVQLVAEQPFKIPFVAAMILYVNQDKPEFTKVILDKTTVKTQDALQNGQWRNLKLYIRFLGCLQELFEGQGVLALLEELFNRAVDLQTASQDDALGLELVKIIMLTLPYIIASSTSDLRNEAAELLGKTDIIASAPRDAETIVDAYIRIEGLSAPQPQSLLSMLQRQLQGEAEQDWPLAVIPRLFKSSRSEDLIDMDDGAPSGNKHALPAIQFPETLNPGPNPIFPELYFSVYADQEYETVPDTSNIAASLIRDALVDTVNILDFNRLEAARFLINLDCYWAPDTFVRRSTPFDKLRDVPSGQSTWKPEDLAIDAIFSQIMQLPAPEHKTVYYHSIITEACKLAPGAIAPSLGRAIRYIYKNLDLLDEELGYRFMDWFSHHLSNYDFRWKWQEWISDVEMDILKPQKSFIVGALHKEMRLSFASRIRQTVPQEYQGLIPASMDNEIPENKFNDPLTPFSAEAKPLSKLIRKKVRDGEDVLGPGLDALRDAVSSSGSGSDPDLVVIDALVTTICYVGSKSLSHVLSFIERTKARLLQLSTSHPQARAQIISSVVGYWQAVQPGVAVTIIDKLLNYTILDPASVIAWVLAPERLNGGRGLAESWVYELISRTVLKVTTRVRQIVAARLQPGLKPDVASSLESTLAAERDAMRALFAGIDDVLRAVAEGSAGVGIPDDEQTLFLLRLWGVKWRRVFARKVAVEEAGVVEGAKCFPPPGEEDEDMDAAGVREAVNGHGNGNGVGNADGAMEDEDLIE